MEQEPSVALLQSRRSLVGPVPSCKLPGLQKSGMKSAFASISNDPFCRKFVAVKVAVIVMLEFSVILQVSSVVVVVESESQPVQPAKPEPKPGVATTLKFVPRAACW